MINQKINIDKLDDIDCYVLDMDGTFNLGNQLIPGALDFYRAAIGAGKRIVFLTNNSSNSGQHYVKKMNALGCNITIENVFTSGMATCMYINKRYKNKRIFLLGNEALREEFASYGIDIVEDEPDIVVVGYDNTIDYTKLCTVCDYIREGLPYIATHPDYNCPTEDGYMPDIGAIMALIEASTDRVADTIVGKPHRHIVDTLVEYTSIQSDRVAIVGDRLYTDIKTGIDHGLLSICVLTGETNMEDIEQSDTKPDLVFDRLFDIVKYLK